MRAESAGACAPDLSDVNCVRRRTRTSWCRSRCRPPLRPAGTLRSAPSEPKGPRGRSRPARGARQSSAFPSKVPLHFETRARCSAPRGRSCPGLRSPRAQDARLCATSRAEGGPRATRTMYVSTVATPSSSPDPPRSLTRCTSCSDGFGSAGRRRVRSRDGGRLRGPDARLREHALLVARVAESTDSVALSRRRTRGQPAPARAATPPRHRPRSRR